MRIVNSLDQVVEIQNLIETRQLLVPKNVCSFLAHMVKAQKSHTSKSYCSDFKKAVKVFQFFCQSFKV